MITYKNILIAVDGSHEAEWAFNRAVGVAKLIQEHILLMKFMMLNLLKNLSILQKNY